MNILYNGIETFEMCCMRGMPADNLFWGRFGFPGADEIQEIKCKY